MTETVKRHCIECDYCQERNTRFGGNYLWCKLIDTEVQEDDYCSFGRDLKPEYEDEDRIYEQYREVVRQRVHR